MRKGRGSIGQLKETEKEENRALDREVSGQIQLEVVMEGPLEVRTVDWRVDLVLSSGEVGVCSNGDCDDDNEDNEEDKDHVDVDDVVDKDDLDVAV